MAYEMKDGEGSLFRNERRETDEQPTHKGSCKLDGVEYWISGWVNTAGPNAKNPGLKFFGLRFQEKDNGFSHAPRSSEKVGQANDFDDDIPF